jgi:hypothetical protein
MENVKFSPEYHCTCIWMKDNDVFKPIEYVKVPISRQLVDELETFDEKVFNIIDWDNPLGPSPMSFTEREQLYRLAKSLCQKVALELGKNYNVIDETDWMKPEE